MTYPQIDARGRACPEPVILTKKAIEKAPEGIVVLVDNTTAYNNVSRFAKSAGHTVSTRQDGTEYEMTLTR